MEQNFAKSERQIKSLIEQILDITKNEISKYQKSFVTKCKVQIYVSVLKAFF